jgi:glucosamine kinase
LSSLDALVEYANSQPAPDFSRLTEVVVRCAELGDETALAVLRQQAEELAYLVRLVIRRLRLASREHEWTPPIAFTGSILENVALVREALIAAVQREFPSVQAPDKVVDPVEGALWRARTGTFE